MQYIHIHIYIYSGVGVKMLEKQTSKSKTKASFFKCIPKNVRCKQTKPPSQSQQNKPDRGSAFLQNNA